MSEPTVYEKLGGAEGLRALVDRFYALMDARTDAAGIRSMHPPELSRSADILFKYLSGWFGGPPIYIEERGHPRLRMRHMPFAIGTAERDAWMQCMTQALAEHVDDVYLRAAIEKVFADMATQLINRMPASGA